MEHSLSLWSLGNVDVHLNVGSTDSQTPMRSEPVIVFSFSLFIKIRQDSEPVLYSSNSTGYHDSMHMYNCLSFTLHFCLTVSKLGASAP